VEHQNTQKTKRRPTRKTMIVIYFYVILILLILSTIATYTWFALSRSPKVSSMSMYITARTGLELALTPEDGDQWGNQVAFPDMVTAAAPLRPVTWSEKDKTFYAAVYGIDGRLTGKWQPLSDERNANRDTYDYDGYYHVGTLYARTAENVIVSLAEEPKTIEGLTGSGTYLIGTPVWSDDEIAHRNDGQGAENAVRIGIQVTFLDQDNRPKEEEPLFFIYEPNCETHTDGSMGYIETPNIDDGGSLVPSDRLITQEHSSWTEADPVQKGVQIYTFGAFTSPVELFRLEAGQKAMIRLYIWLEGQDVDCTNAIRESQILANIQFDAVTDNGSGMVPIE